MGFNRNALSEVLVMQGEKTLGSCTERYDSVDQVREWAVNVSKPQLKRKAFGKKHEITISIKQGGDYNETFTAQI